MSFIKYDSDLSSIKKIIYKLKEYKFFALIIKAVRYLKGITLYIKELFDYKKKKYGKIKMIKGYFEQLKDYDYKVDAVVSLSAIEHCDLAQIRDSLDGFISILKKNTILLLTTSVTSADENKFEDYFQGWSFSKNGLKDYFKVDVTNKEINDNYKLISNSKAFWKNIDPYYFQKKNSYFYDYQLSNKIPYIPIGIKFFFHGKN